MKFPLYLFSIAFLIIILLVQPKLGQNFESDPEVNEIRSRITDVTWDISYNNQNSGTVSNETYVQFTVELELWNPYDRELISYGSSSCRWFSILEISFAETHEIENSGETCTADYGPRKYSSGLSNETSNPGLVFLNESLQLIPDGNITITGQGGTFGNSIDPAYGVSIEIIGGNASYTYQQIPKNWGEIIFFGEKSSTSFQLTSPFSAITFIGSVSTIYITIFRLRKY